MKSVIALVVSAISLCSFGEYMSQSNAVVAASNWMAERHSVCPPSVIVGCETVSNSTGAAYHVVKLFDGRCILMTSDSSCDPIIAVVSGALREDGSRKSGLPIWDMADRDCVVVPAQNLPKLKSSTKKRTWAGLLGGIRRRLMTSGSGSSPSQYILPGFEEGGSLTHWNQTEDKYSYGPLYNYFIHDAASGGTDEGGLKMSFLRDDGKYYQIDNLRVPCGCVATAYAAVLQYESVTGCVFNTSGRSKTISRPNSYYFDGTRWTETDVTTDLYANPFPTEFAWWKLPVQFGGKVAVPNPFSYWQSTASAGARRVIGSAAYDCGIAVSMGYGWSESGAYPIRFVRRLSCNNPFVTSFPGFCVKPASYAESWTEASSDEWIRSGHPVVMHIVGQSGNHCVLGVGRDSDEGLTRVFMGWGGSGDGWYNTSATVTIPGFSSITASAMLTDRRSGVVPLYGKIVSSGSPVGGAPVFAKVGGSIVGTAITDESGYFRMLYRPESYGSLDEKVYAAGTLVSSRTRSVSVSTNSIDTLVKPDGGVWYSTSFQFGNANLGTLSVPDPAIGEFSTVARTWEETDAILDEKSKSFDPVFVYCGDGSSSVPVPSGVFSVYMITNSVSGAIPGEYAVIDTRKYRGRTLFSSGDHVLSYGVSTNKVDIDEYVRKANEKLTEDFRR